MAAIAMTTPQLALVSTAEKSHSASPNSLPHNLVWSPPQDALSGLVDLLKQSTTGHSSVQHHLYAQLQRRAADRDFNNYLVYILAHGFVHQNSTQPDVDGVRRAAGLLLKSNIRLMFHNLHPQVQAYISAQLLTAIGDNSQPIRAVVSTCISAIVVSKRDIVAFSGLITTLVQCLESNRYTFVDGALTVLSHLAEDAPDLLAEDPSQPLDTLLPKIVAFCRHDSDSVRATALQILNHLILVMPPALQANVDVLCQTLFSIAEHSSSHVRKRVCTAICLLLEMAPLALVPYMNSVIEYMLRSSADDDEQVAREASEFWNSFAEAKGAVEILRPFLPRIVSVLLTNMVYSPEERAALDAENVQDDMIHEDMRPRFHQPRFVSTSAPQPPTNSFSSHQVEPVPSSSDNGSRNGSADGSGSANGSNHRAVTDDDDDDDDDETESASWDDYKEESEWNVRKCSAAALDAFSTLFGEELLEILLPKLQEKLTDSNRWEHRECGVLALGAIADGCYTGMLRHMHSIFDFLLHSASDVHYMVRSISCWTLSRYSRWVISERDDSSCKKLLHVLLDRILDPNKVVQKASCSALATFQEKAGTMLLSYIPHILKSITAAFEQYPQSSIICLYDVVCALADAVGSELATLDHMNVLMPPLTVRWNSIADTDPSMLPLLECLGCVLRAMGGRSQQFAENIFARCANIIDVVYASEASGEREDIHLEFLTCTLDLMCGLSEALGASVDPYVAKSGNGSKPLLPLLFVAMKDGRQEVRQSAFALLGEFARARIPSLIPALPEYVRCGVDALNPEYMSVSNNATWALGELIMMAGFLPPNVPVDRETIQRTLMEGALESLIRVVNISQLNRSLVENSAITLGRMGLVMPEAMAPRLELFAEAVFSALRNIRDDIEKEQAFHGMNCMVKQNPRAIIPCFVFYADAIASWFHCTPELEMDFSSILTGFKTTLGDHWYSLFNSFPVATQSVLKDRFRL